MCVSGGGEEDESHVYPVYSNPNVSKQLKADWTFRPPQPEDSRQRNPPYGIKGQVTGKENDNNGGVKAGTGRGQERSEFCCRWKLPVMEDVSLQPQPP